MKSLLRISLLLVLLLPSLASAEPVTTVPSGDSAALTAAIASVPEGGIIELASGTYVAPSGGFDINTPGKSFTLRGQADGSSILSGGGTGTILRYINATFTATHSVVFENLVLQDGFTDTNGVGAGATLTAVTATFVNCQFLDNTAEASSTGGGGLFIFGASRVHIFDSLFQNNTSTNEGGGLRVGGDSEAYVYNTQFLDNQVNVANHRPLSAGGGIHVTNSRLSVANSRFVGNEAVVGGAIFGFGGWDNPEVADLLIVNSTFTDNASAPHPSVTPVPADTGGAIHSEDEVTVRIYSSRFYTNTGTKGGAFSQYRSDVEVYDSVFRGNEAITSGGTISAGSEDAFDATTDFGAINRPSMSLKIFNSLIQGEFETSNPGPDEEGGCLFATGDIRRTYGNVANIPQMGTAATNRAPVEIVDTVFTDCNVTSTNNNFGKGGAINLAHVELNMRNSLIQRSSANAPNGQGGALRSTIESDLTITNTTFAENFASLNGGAMILTGSTLNLSNSQFFKNTNGSGNAGSALQTALHNGLFGFVELNMEGTVSNTVFSEHTSIPIREVDNTNGPPINNLQYEGNSFFGTTSFFSNSLAGTHSVASLNSLTVTRTSGGSTNKSPSGDNVELGSQPDLGVLIAVPPQRYATNAAGDSAPPTDSFLGWAWCSDSAATLDGLATSGNSGLEASTVGIHTLTVGAEDFLAEITNATIPSAALSATDIEISSGETSDLQWVGTGTALETHIDRGVGSVSTSSSTTVMPGGTRVYRQLLFTEEGGAVDDVKIYVDEPAGDSIFSDDFESGNANAWTFSIGL